MAINGTTSLNISVSDPTGLTATRLNTGLTHLRLFWSTVSEATGYEVFYQLSNNAPISIDTTTNTSFDITTILTLGNIYTFYVVSYVDTDAFLPSENSSAIVSLGNPEVTDLIATNITSTSFSLSWSLPPDIFPPNNFNIQFECHRQCEASSPVATQASVSSPYVIHNISPYYSNCSIDLIGLYDKDNYTLASVSVQTLSTVPSTPVSNVKFASVGSVSMTVSWDEVPCDGRNGLITGYYLTYTDIASNTSYTVNITGEDNRMYNLTGLMPYTNYTVSIMPYNAVGMGPPSDNVTQQTLESTPSAINGLMMNDFSPYSLSMVWNPPTMPNGIITVYEIRYRESTSTGRYNITNTTNTYYSIVGLTPNTSYTIGVRVYTSIGPGEWTEMTAKTPLISSVKGLMVIPLNASSVYVSWMIPNISPLSHYTLYYNESTDDVFSVNLSNTSTHEVITELTGSSTEYEFRISVTIGDFEGELSELVQPGSIQY
uniref:Fibronectin type-III domain-containing protein n=1 Tax=Amphimedon queenslandica TaxID=400682 RepID=A0A1X7SR16_AMPQE